MDSRHAARHTHALDLARRALAFGARHSTVGFLTGLDRWALRRYFVFDPEEWPKAGNRPSSPECFLKNATLFTMVDASVVYAIYRDHRDRWPDAAEALLSAYGHYARRRVPPELSFDRAFYLVSWTDRLWSWAGREAVFRLTACARCHCRYLALPAPADDHARDCPFCKLKLRYGHEPRIRVRFAERKYPQVTEALAQLVTSAGSAPSPVTGS